MEMPFEYTVELWRLVCSIATFFQSKQQLRTPYQIRRTGNGLFVP